MGIEDEIDSLRAERDEWRRRAEVAEAVAAERLARAETAERALRGAGSGRSSTAAAGDETPSPPKRPATLLERWRRYTDTLN